MNILVAGGSGFIGRHVALWAANRGHHVTATYCPRVDGPGNDLVTWAARHLGITPLECDLLHEVPELGDFDACLYAAGNANHTRALHDPVMDVEANVLSLLHFLPKFHGRLVFMSSGAVYYGARGLVSPATPVFPTFPYAISKVASEMYIRSFAERGLLCGYVLVRFYYAYGPGEPQRRLMPQLIKALAREETREFAINGSGQTFMAPMYISDVAESLGRIIESSVANQTFDLCSECPITLYELVQRTARWFGRDVQITHRDSDERPLEFWSSNEAARRAFALPAQLSLEDGLARYVAWLQPGPSA